MIDALAPCPDWQPVELRPMPCDRCGGDGGWDRLEPSWNEHGAIPYGREVWVRCEACEGTGELDVEFSAIEMEDLDDMCGTEAEHGR